MMDDFRPLTLSDVARQLGLDPFEVVRLLVQAGALPDNMQFKAEHVDRLRQATGKR